MSQPIPPLKAEEARQLSEDARGGAMADRFIREQTNDVLHAVRTAAGNGCDSVVWTIQVRGHLLVKQFDTIRNSWRATLKGYGYSLEQTGLCAAGNPSGFSPSSSIPRANEEESHYFFRTRVSW